MNMILYFDTETTGLYPGQICQLSYVMQDKENLIAKNFFFSVDCVEREAFNVHGFSVEKLSQLSNGKRFNHHFNQINKDFETADLVVSHNISFDFSFMRKEYERLNQTFCVKNEFCSMKKTTPICKFSRSNNKGYKYPKLQELCNFLSISDQEILELSKTIFGEETGFHDARFDTTALCLAINRCIEKKYFRQLEEYL